MAAVDSHPDRAVRERIVQSVNAEYSASLPLILEHFVDVGASDATGALLTEITLNRLTIEVPDGQSFPIELHPSLKSYEDVLTRIQEMDTRSRKALGVRSEDNVGMPSKQAAQKQSPPKGGQKSTAPPSSKGGTPSEYLINEFSIPTPAGLAVIALVIWAVITCTNPNSFRPGGFYYEAFLYRFPRIAKFLSIAQWGALFIIFTVHPAEAWWLHQSRLRITGPKTGSRNWWKWMVGHFLEGYPSFTRYDRDVRRQKKEKKISSN